MTTMKHEENVINDYAKKTNKQIGRSKAISKTLFETVREGYEALQDCKESLSFFKMKVLADRSTINKMIKIASSDFVIRNLDRLPLSWSTLYTVATTVGKNVTVEDAEAMLDEGLIKPSSSQKQVVDVFAKNQGIESGSDEDEDVIESGGEGSKLTIYYNPVYVADEDREKVDQALSMLAECGFEIFDSLNSPNAKKEAA